MVKILGAFAALFVLIGGLWTAGEIFATDVELAAVAAAQVAAVSAVKEQHAVDKISGEDARKNDRVDRINRDIVKQKRLLRGTLVPEDRHIEETVLQDMKQLKQNIIEGIE